MGFGVLHQLTELLEGPSMRCSAFLAEQVRTADLGFVNLDLACRRSALDLELQFAGQLRVWDCYGLDVPGCISQH
jgi:hypothetical protein